MPNAQQIGVLHRVLRAGGNTGVLARTIGPTSRTALADEGLIEQCGVEHHTGDPLWRVSDKGMDVLLRDAAAHERIDTARAQHPTAGAA